MTSLHWFHRWVLKIQRVFCSWTNPTATQWSEVHSTQLLGSFCLLGTIQIPTFPDARCTALNICLHLPYRVLSYIYPEKLTRHVEKHSIAMGLLPQTSPKRFVLWCDCAAFDPPCLHTSSLRVPSGKGSQYNYGKSPYLMGKLTISVAMFNSYVKIPEGRCVHGYQWSKFQTGIGPFWIVRPASHGPQHP